MKALAFGAAAGSLWSSYRSMSSSAAAVQAKAAAPPSPFSTTDFTSFPLVNVYDESHDTKVLRFALPAADALLNLPVASCISLRYVDSDGKDVVRPYTPISKVDQQGYFEILIKKYKDSKMGNHLHSLKIGQTIDIKGPWVKIPLKANQYKTIGMIAGGTGIAPMFQVAREILRTPKNTTEISLIYANRRKEDVLLGNELNELTELYPLFSPYFVLSKPPSDWMSFSGMS
ncbi:NADH-cytochrome b5 reductase, putative [Bodo saltans]|uniref:NADH-cytochrome b5 reductase n=1 Tax=Bodo saltans TaxID=75058 RepID=A0A0S4INB8_BODSA|nr:NADH-cytochrome b5 reductase, putative [Bodo saltans]|eukprot:CUE83903.1 NADH-cytochrome b5 reductase, putative [Bodo saltans]